MRPPFETDHVLTLRTRLEEVQPLLQGPSAIAEWFPTLTRRRDRDQVMLTLEPGPLSLRGSETWNSDRGALLFASREPQVSGFLTLRSVILSQGLGTEIWIHAETTTRRGAGRLRQTIDAVIHAGLAHMSAELDRSDSGCRRTWHSG